MAQGQGQNHRRGGDRSQRDEPKEFEERVLDVARVTRVTKGGKRMRFRATLIIGDRKGRVGFAIEKGADVALAVSKATRTAKKHLIRVPMIRETIPHEVREKFGAAVVLLKPAPRGTGIKAGGAMRVVLEMAGVSNVVGKQMGTANKITNAKAMMAALSKLRLPQIKETTKQSSI